MAMRSFLKALITTGIKLRARESFAAAIRLGLNGQYYMVRDVVQCLAQIDVGIQDMINGCTIDGVGFLVAALSRDGIVAPVEVEWLIGRYRVNDADAANRVAGMIISHLLDLLVRSNIQSNILCNDCTKIESW
jgi:hypothetical protein